MKLICIAGPYRAATIAGIHNNIELARQAAAEVWAAGFYALCPHMNSAFLDGVAPDEVFLMGGLEMVRRCDAVLVLPSFDGKNSKGTVREANLAVDLGIPCVLAPTVREGIASLSQYFAAVNKTLC